MSFRNFKPEHGIVIVALAAALAAPNAGAQDADAIEEIIVTADKRSERSVQDLASSITAFDEQKLERLDVLDFDDFIVQVPGTNFINDGGPGRGNEVASIRGLSTVADNTVGVVAQYLDGAPHFGNSYRFFDIGEVAVLRGPQGTLWGSQSIGGLIYFRSNRPDPQRLSGHIQGDVYSSSGDGGASQRMSGVLNVPLIEDVLAVRMAAQFIDETGYIDNARTSTEDINEVEESAWRLSVLYEPTDNLSFTAIYHGNDLDAAAPTYFELDLDGLQVDQPSDYGPARQNYDLFNFIAEADLGRAILTYNGSKFSNDGGYTDFDDSTGSLLHETTTIDEEATTHELRLSSAGDGPLQWIAGYYYDDYENFNQLRDFTLDDLDDTDPVEGTTQGGLVILKEQAFFGEVSYALTDRLTVLAGGRFFDWEIDNREVFLIGGSDIGFVTNGVASDDDFFHKFQLEYRFTDQLMAYALRSEGFRYGGFNTFVGEALFGIPEQYFEFGPDKLVSYETGIKSSLADGRVLLNGSIYFLDWQNVQAVVQSDQAGAFGQGFFTTNAPDLEATGFELELVTRNLILPGFYGALSWGYTDNEFQDDAQLFPGTRVNIRKGDSLRRTPRNTYSLDVGYEFDIGGAAGYIRTNYWHKDSTSTFGFNSNDGNVDVPAQDIVNFSAGVNWERYQLKLYIDNVTDEVPLLNVFAGGSAGNPGADEAVRANTLRPRTIGLEGTFYFGANR